MIYLENQRWLGNFAKYQYGDCGLTLVKILHIPEVYLGSVLPENKVHRPLYVQPISFRGADIDAPLWIEASTLLFQLFVGDSK
jgi:hypothetical protein